jgi:glycosyltransferase involved in cell wall biosynthesis
VTSPTIPQVSIGMPVYNGAQYIREALDTLLDQSFADFELIISDNASTDATESICREYAAREARISYVRQKSNIGAPANFHYVLECAVGRYFMWAACDDRWSRDWLEKMYGALSEPDVGMAFGQVAHIDAEGRAMNHPANGVTFVYGYSTSSVVRRLMFYLDFEGLGKANSIYSAYKRELLGPLTAMWREMIEGRLLYDFTIIYHCLKFTKIKQVNQATLFKRVHRESEGASQTGQDVSLSNLARRAAGMLWPYPPRLIRDYLRYSSAMERMLLLALFAVKLLVAYHHKLKQVVSTKKRGSDE